MNTQMKFRSFSFGSFRYIKSNYDLQYWISDASSGSKRSFDEMGWHSFANKTDKNNAEIYLGDIVKIERDGIDSDGNKYYNLFGEIKQLNGGQYYINHKKVNLKYAHQIHCEVCETESPVFFLDFFESYELEIIGNVYEHPNLIEQ